jgi:hypothetical protein
VFGILNHAYLSGLFAVGFLAGLVVESIPFRSSLAGAASLAM